MSLIVQHNRNDVKDTVAVMRDPTRSIWSRFSPELYAVDPTTGFHYFDDFIGEVGNALAVSGDNSAYHILDEGDPTQNLAGDDISDTDTRHGYLEQVGSATADTGVGFRLAIAELDLAEVSRWAFEFRFATSSVATNWNKMFFGLADSDVAGTTTTVLAADGTVATALDHVGFNVTGASATAVNVVYGTTAATSMAAGVKTLVADTYTKLGLVYDQKFPDTEKIQIWVDGQKYATFGTQTMIDSAQWPDAIPLKLFCITQGETTTAATNSYDWIRLAAEWTT